MNTCTPEFQRLASQAGGIDCAGANAIVTFTSPFALHHWTMPLIEVTLVVGAIACLVHAVRWKRDHDDASNLVVWWSGILALLFIEPVAYFPEWFGLEQSLGLTFIHNQFSVQFLYNRLPLYIVAMYPVFAYVAYVLVQRTGVFERHGAIVSGVCVAFTFHVIYETIDHVGPQFRWWIWNTQHPILSRGVGVVPYASLKGFAIDIPFGIALLTRWLATGRGQSGWRIARNVLLVSAGVWPIMMLTSIPGGLLERAGVPGDTVRVVQLWVILGGTGLVTAWALADAYRARVSRRVHLPDGIETDRFALACVAVYFIVAAVCWAAAMPDYLAARDGLTSTGAPIGWFPYSATCAILSTAIVASAYLGRAPSRTVGSEAARFARKVVSA